jgi:hypothetical protein
MSKHISRTEATKRIFLPLDIQMHCAMESRISPRPLRPVKVIEGRRREAKLRNELARHIWTNRKTIAGGDVTLPVTAPQMLAANDVDALLSAPGMKSIDNIMSMLGVATI